MERQRKKTIRAQCSALDEIIVDNFAGGGGASTGIELAAGRIVDIAINHDPDAILMHKTNHPYTQHLQASVWDVDPAEVCAGRPVGLAWFSPDCFPSGTMVLTDKGYRAIEGIRVGDMVLTHKQRWRKVTETSNTRKPLISVKGYGHPGLLCSKEHPFYTRKRDNVWNNGIRQYRAKLSAPTWKPAGELGKGEYWATPTVVPPLPIPEMKRYGGGIWLPIDSRLLWLAGQYVGDGWTRKTNTRAELVITCGERKARKLVKALDMWPRKGKRAQENELSWVKRHTNTAIQFTASGRALAEWLRDNFGHLSHNKKIPGWLYGAPRELREAFLSGYMSADGWSEKDTRQATTVSRSLAYGVKQLLATMSISTTVYTARNTTDIQGRKVNSKLAYLMRWRLNVDEAHKQVFNENEMIWSAIKHVKPASEEPVEVYNIGVEEDESFVAEGVIVHNCKHFSKAKGGKPVDKQIRGLSWVVLRWGLEAPPRVIMMENVEEIQTWGPVITGADGKQYPDPERKGETFQGFIGMLTSGIPEDHPALEEACEFLKIRMDGAEAQQLVKGLGYSVEWRELVAADYGAPTTRKRFFLIARRDGRPIVWPESTHAPASSEDAIRGIKRPWRSAAEIIDWDLPTPSIFDDRATIKARYGLNAQRPLRPNTMRRVIRGVEKFVIKSADPFLVIVNHSGDFRGQALTEPLQTVTAKNGYGTVDPYMVPWTVTNTTNSTGHSADQPMDTIRTGGGGGQMLLAASMMAIGQTGGGDRTRKVDEPIHTTVSKAEECLVTPSLIQYHTEKPSEQARGQKADDPLMTIDTNPRYAMTVPALVKYYGNDAHGQDVHVPLHTVTSKDREGVVAASMTEYHGQSVGARLGEPLATTLSKEHQGIVAANLSKFYSGNYTGSGSKMSEPLHTVTAIDHNALSAAHMVKMKGTNLGGPVSEPVQTITAGGGHFGSVVTRVTRAQNGADLKNWPKIRSLLNEFCGYHLADDEVILFNISGVWYFMADIGLRMLTPRELYRANGFPPDYVIERDYMGDEYGKTKQVARCGNAVPPPFATALVRANLPEWCGEEITTMEQLGNVVAI